AGEQFVCGLIQRYRVSSQVLEQLCFGQTTDGNDSDDSGTIGIDEFSFRMHSENSFGDVYARQDNPAIDIDVSSMTTMGGGPTDWHSAAASALGKPSKSQRSRARSGQLQCRVGRLRRRVLVLYSIRKEYTANSK